MAGRAVFLKKWGAGSDAPALQLHAAGETRFLGVCLGAAQAGRGIHASAALSCTYSPARCHSCGSIHPPRPAPASSKDPGPRHPILGAFSCTSQLAATPFHLPFFPGRRPHLQDPGPGLPALHAPGHAAPAGRRAAEAGCGCEVRLAGASIVILLGIGAMGLNSWRARLARRTAHSRASTCAPLCCNTTAMAGSRPGCAATLPSAAPLSQPLPCICFLPVPLLAPLLKPPPCVPSSLPLFQRQSGRRGRGGRRWRGARRSGSISPPPQQAFACVAAAVSSVAAAFISGPHPASAAICSPHFRLTNTFIVGTAARQLHQLFTRSQSAAAFHLDLADGDVHCGRQARQPAHLGAG